MHFTPPQASAETLGRPYEDNFFFCFFASDFRCVAELVSNYVSKYQVQPPKIGRDIAILPRAGPLARPSVVSVLKEDIEVLT